VLILVRIRFLGIRQFLLLPKTTSLLGIKRKPKRRTQEKQQRQLLRKLRRKVQKRILSAVLVS
jgi:hypothetical protein